MLLVCRIVSRLSVESVDTHPHLIRVVYLVTCREPEFYTHERIMVDHFYLRVGKTRFLDQFTRPDKEPQLRFDFTESTVIDVKPSSNKIWVLQEHGLWELNMHRRFRNRYSRHEAFISKQLLQDFTGTLESFYNATCSMFSSKDHMIGFISSIFLHRLLQPGVCCLSVLRSTLTYYKKHWTEDDFSALTIDGLRREILSVIKQMAITGNPLSVLKSWKDFCFQYILNWKWDSAPVSLLVDSQSGAVGLIRRNNVSIFRSFGDTELLMHCTHFEEIVDPYSVYAPPRDNLESTILLKMLDCVRILNQQLCPDILSAIFIELVGGALPESSKATKCGYSTSTSDLCESLGADFVWQKGFGGHRIGLSEFSFHVLQSVDGLRIMAKNWSIILSVLKTYVSFLVPQKLMPNMENYDSNTGIFDIKIPIIVQATSQVAGLMLESALGIFLFLSYLLTVSSQVELLPDDISMIQLELIPMVSNIISEWFIIHLFTTTPSVSPSKEDNLNDMLSSLRIDESGRQRSWTKKLGSFDFTLAFVLLLDAHEGCTSWSSSSLPSPNSFADLMRHFISWLHRKSREKPLYEIENTTELTQSLLRNGQFNAVEILNMILDTHWRGDKLFESYVHGDGHLLHHLLNCCLLAKPYLEHVNL